MVPKKWILVLLCLVLSRCAIGEHSPLLPRPQQVRYGSGTVQLHGIRIMLPESAIPADRFAAEQLQTWMQERTGQEVTIGAFGNDADGDLPIMLERKGNQR